MVEPGGRVAVGFLAVEVTVAVAGGAGEGLYGAFFPGGHELAAPVSRVPSHRRSVVLQALLVSNTTTLLDHHHLVVVVTAAVMVVVVEEVFGREYRTAPAVGCSGADDVVAVMVVVVVVEEVVVVVAPVPAV